MSSACDSQAVLICSPAANAVWVVGEPATVVWNPRHPDVVTQQSLNIYVVDLQNVAAPAYSWMGLQLSQSEFSVTPNFTWFNDYKQLYSATAPITRSFKLVPSLGAFNSGDTVSTNYAVSVNLRADSLPADATSTSTSDSTATSVMTVTASAAAATVTQESIVDVKPRSLSAGAIAGIAVGGAVLLVALLLLAFLLRRRRRAYKGQLLADEDSKSSPYPRNLAAGGGALSPPGAVAVPGRRSVATDDLGFAAMGRGGTSPRFAGEKAASLDSAHASSIGGDSAQPLASNSKHSVGSFSPVDAALIADAYRQKLREPAFDILPDDRQLLSDDHLPESPEPRHSDEMARRRQIAEERMRRELADQGQQLKTVSRGKTIVRHVGESTPELAVSAAEDSPASPSPS
ncbi:hypothetical protein IWQ60_010401 [Tieghemiomyces parasiticus]|uniref:Uncharacterized protein n=1 Tax=Tieghemiomyces parasiticus TaxID=78921 RepID=A0A9W7ZUL7_9FUNG|nr:hypothetical protein IWQ60_010401 [Tieghemiomyces parasiticus]